MKRRENNTGTIYKLSGTRSRPWLARICIGYTDDKRLWQTVGYFRTKAEASKALAQQLIDPVSPKAGMTLAEVYAEWSAGHYRRCRPKTAEGYTMAYNYLKPLEKKQFSEIRTAHFQQIIDTAQVGLATLQKVKVLCGLLYKYAMENDIVRKNYAEFIRLPKAEKTVKAVIPDTEIAIYKKHDTESAAQIMLMLIYSGLRIQELLSLTVFDVDLQKRCLVGGIKTDAGKNRTVPIADQTFTYWQQWVSNAIDGIIFHIDGRPIKPDYYRKRMLYPLQDNLGLQRRTPHQARHTCATLLANRGVAPLTIQQILGHSDYALTANIYTHPDYKRMADAINKL